MTKFALIYIEQYYSRFHTNWIFDVNSQFILSVELDDASTDCRVFTEAHAKRGTFVQKIFQGVHSNFQKAQVTFSINAYKVAGNKM